MAKFYKVSLVVFVIQMSFQVSTSMYDIYRGDVDMFSRAIVRRPPRKCDSKDYCSCGRSKTFTYDTATRKGMCELNDKFRVHSGK